MKVPYVNCATCLAQIEGPFDTPSVLPPDVCPHCGGQTWTDGTGPMPEGAQLRMDNQGSLHVTPEAMVEELLSGLEKASGGNTELIEHIADIRGVYAELRKVLPGSAAAVVVLDSARRAAQDFMARVGPREGPSKLH